MSQKIKTTDRVGGFGALCDVIFMRAIQQPIEHGTYGQVEKYDRREDDGHDDEIHIVDACAEGEEPDQNANHRKLYKQHSSVEY